MDNYTYTPVIETFYVSVRRTNQGMYTAITDQRPADRACMHNEIRIQFGAFKIWIVEK